MNILMHLVISFLFLSLGSLTLACSANKFNFLFPFCKLFFLITRYNHLKILLKFRCDALRSLLIVQTEFEVKKFFHQRICEKSEFIFLVLGETQHHSGCLFPIGCWWSCHYAVETLESWLLLGIRTSVSSVG